MNPNPQPRLQPFALAIAAALSALSGVPAQAQQATTAGASDERITIVGTRRLTTVSSATDTAVPVDIYSLAKTAESGGQFDLAQSLQFISPSFNSTRQTGADGADLIDSAALRGLGSDQTLVLVNGKRRHTVALVNLFGARNRGNTGTDMNALPLLAIDNVQVLRDGAAAQYGSDAIAGVINIALKKRAGCEAVVAGGQYSKGDGDNALLSAYCGFKLGGGTLALTAEWQDRGRSNRAEPGNPRIIGDTKVRNETLYLNSDFPLTPETSLYVTAGVQERRASSAAFARGGVGSDDIPSRNSEAMYPNGFVPFINGDISDRWGSFGVKSKVGDWQLDLSQTIGSNSMRYDISRTLNASIANQDLLAGGRGISASTFDAGGFSFRQSTTNFDLSRFYADLLGGSNLAFGAELRRESYSISAGELGSYSDADGVGFGGNAGSQGFPGFQPSDVTSKSRSSRALYTELESTPTAALTTQLALRHESYSDFGSTTTGKLAGSLRVSPAALLRASASTGFRAPSLQQVFFSSTFTDFISGKALDVVLAPNGGVIANAAGIPKLKDETSRNFTLGATFKPAGGWAVTADFYRIEIKDRIVLSGRFDADNYPALAATLASLGVGQAQFFVNSVDTSTQGVDLTVSHKMSLQGGSQLSSNLSLNKGRTRVSDVHAPQALAGFEDVLLSERERLFIEQGGPSLKATLGFEYQLGAWTSDLKIIHFGSQTLGTFSGTANGVPNARYAPRTSADLSFSVALNKSTRLSFGGNNIFNVKPSKQDANETDNGFIYDSVQFGLNGASYFAKLHMSF